MRKLPAVAVMVMALVAAGCTSAAARPTTSSLPPPTPAVDLSATPPGWVPVAYGDAQISVPATWVVILNGNGSCSARPPGYVVLGRGKFIPDCRPPADARWLPSAFLGPLVGGITPGPSVEIHGIRAVIVRETCDGCLVYQFPSLGLVVATNERQVMDTLTRSPRAVAMARGPAPNVPSSWRRLSFAGVTVAVPSAWSAERTETYYSLCGGTPITLGAGVTTTLDTDQHFDASRCLIAAAGQPVTPPLNGLVIDSGLGWVGTLSRRCWSLPGLSACLVAAFSYSVLVLSVRVPGRAKPVIVSIGLGGNGMTARNILYSLRAA